MSTSKEHEESEKNDAARIELHNLERQFRGMKNDNVACPKDLRIALTQQGKLIKILENEKEQLIKDISINQDPNAKENLNTVTSLVNDYDQLSQNINDKNEILTDLKSQIKGLKTKTEKLEKKIAPYLKTIEVLKREEIITENLEKQLYVENLKLNEEMCKTKKYREEIDLLLHQRNTFKEKFNVLSSELALGKKILCDLIEQGTDAYNQRKEAEKKLIALKTKAKNDLVHNCSAADVQQRKVEHNEMLNEFIAIKSHKRNIEKLEAEKTNKKEEEIIKMEEHLHKYTDVLNDLMERFNVTDYNQLVVNFIKLEENNYNIYSFNNELNKKLDILRSEKKVLHEKIIKKQDGNKNKLVEHSNKIEKLKEELNFKRIEVDLSQAKLMTSKNNVETLLYEIQELFNLFSCEYGSIRQKLGKNSRVTKDNSMLFLKALEARFQDFSANAAYIFQRTTPGKIKSGTLSVPKSQELKPISPPHPCALCAEAKDISEADESIAVPVDVETAKLNLIEELKKGNRADLLHSVAECRLPKSRRIIQNRLN